MPESLFRELGVKLCFYHQDCTLKKVNSFASLKTMIVCGLCFAHETWSCDRSIVPASCRVENGSSACATFLGELEHAITAVGTPAARKCGFQLLAAVCVSTRVLLAS